MRPEGLERWVVNLTDWTLTPAQEDALKLGLNFAPVPSKLLLPDTMAAVESGSTQTHCFMHRITNLPTIEAHHIPHIPTYSRT